MQGDPEIIELLNEVLTAELTAINQYFIHAKMRENWGFTKLAAVARKESIEEMEDADKIIERILYLDGVPNLQRYNPVLVGETVPEQLELELRTETEAIERYNRGIALAVAKGDGLVRVSRETKGRGGKAVTVVKGVVLDADALAGLGKQLKAACGSGGTVKDGVIEVQGDHVERVMEALKKLGHQVKRAGG